MPGVVEAREPGASDRDGSALDRPALWEALDAFDESLDRTRDARTASDQVTAAAAVLRGDRDVLLAVLHAPGLLRERIAGRLGELASVERVWVTWCGIAEAAWQVVSGAATGPGFAPGDVELLWPLAARQRFLVLTEPLRHGTPWGIRDAPSVAFGDDSRHVYLARCREARRIWQQCLDEYQSHPLLAEVSPAALEWELDQVTFRCADPNRADRVLVASLRSDTQDSRPLPAMDAAVAMDVAEQHLLPRFRLTRVGRIAFAGLPRAAAWGAGGVVLLIVGALVPAALSWFVPGAWAAVAAFLLLGTQVAWHGRRWAMLWLLRLPAAGAVGLVLLIALAPTWWQSPSLRWVAPAVLVGASFGYLVVEARNHGVGGVAALLRGLVVTGVGCAHAFLVALVGLVAVAPSYAGEAFATDGGHSLDSLWRDPAVAGEAWRVLALATAWCLAVGVFSQILWEDRPISAPLAHLQWRRGRRP